MSKKDEEICYAFLPNKLKTLGEVRNNVVYHKLQDIRKDGEGIYRRIFMISPVSYKIQPNIMFWQNAYRLFIFGDFYAASALVGIGAERFVTDVIIDNKLPKKWIELGEGCKLELLSQNGDLSKKQVEKLTFIRKKRNQYAHAEIGKVGFGSEKAAADMINAFVVIIQEEADKTSKPMKKRLGSK